MNRPNRIAIKPTMATKEPIPRRTFLPVVRLDKATAITHTRQPTNGEILSTKKKKPLRAADSLEPTGTPLANRERTATQTGQKRNPANHSASSRPFHFAMVSPFP
jgi:hypothetical protein